MTSTLLESVNTEEMNLDDWLDGVQRTERSVTLYGRADLLAEIDELEAKKRQLNAIDEDDEALDGGGAAFAIQEKIDALMIAIDASKMVFHVSFLEDTELDAIRAAVKEDLKDEADAAAALARKEALEKCRRLEIKQANDINTIARQMASAAIDNVFEREVTIRTIAAAARAKLPKKPEPVAISVEQVRKLYSKVGDSQIALISQAYSRATIEAPQVTVPKSSKPSSNDDGLTSS